MVQNVHGSSSIQDQCWVYPMEWIRYWWIVSDFVETKSEQLEQLTTCWDVVQIIYGCNRLHGFEWQLVNILQCKSNHRMWLTSSFESIQGSYVTTYWWCWFDWILWRMNNVYVVLPIHGYFNCVLYQCSEEQVHWHVLFDLIEENFVERFSYRSNKDWFYYVLIKQQN